jgi:hypothetical protein
LKRRWPVLAGPDGLAAVGLFAVVAATFAEALFTSRVFYQRDIFSYWYPHIEAFVRAVAEGSLPLWNPYVGFGTPFLADPSPQLAYPLTWLNLALPPSAYYKVFVVFHCLLAGAGLQALARRLGLSPLASFVAGAAWSVSGPLLSAVSLFHHFAGAAWSPWVLLALERLLSLQTNAAALVLGATAAGQLLAGSGDMCLMTATAALVRVAVFLFAERGRRRGSAAILLGQGLLAAVFAAGLAAVQWVPAIALLLAGARSARGSEASFYWSVHPMSLVDLVVPRFMADLPMNEALRALLFEAREPLLVCLYLGVPITFLALLGLVASDAPRRLVSAGLFAFFLVAALGRHTLVYPLLALVPPFGFMRFPAKYTIAAGIFFALLAAEGVDAWRSVWGRAVRSRALAVIALAGLAGVGAFAVWVCLARAPESARAWLDLPAGESVSTLLGRSEASLARTAGLAILCCLLGAARARQASPRGGFTGALVALGVLDLVGVGARVNQLAPADLLRVRPSLLAHLDPVHAPTRIYSVQYSHERLRREIVRGPAGWEGPWTWSLGLIDKLEPPVGGRWRLFGSYDGDFTGLGTAPPAVVTQIMRATEGSLMGLRLLQMGSVDYAVALEATALGELPVVAEEASVFTHKVQLIRIPDSLPKVYAVDGVRVASEPASFNALAQPDFDPRREVILAAHALPTAPTHGFAGSARVTRRSTNRLEVEADLSAPGYVVSVEAYRPGWKATVDGSPTEILRANVLFRAVRVPAGRHHLVFRYDPLSVPVGALLTAASLLGAAGFGWRHLGPNARRSSPLQGPRP